MTIKDYCFKDMNPTMFDCLNPITDPSAFYELDAVMIDFNAHEMSGTNCYVAYVLDSREEIFKREMFTIKNDADMQSYTEYFIETADAFVKQFTDWLDTPDVVYQHLLEQVNAGKILLVIPAMRSSLKPYTQKGADMMMKAAIAEVQRTERRANEENLDTNWYYERHLPFKYEELGRTTAMCATLVE